MAAFKKYGWIFMLVLFVLVAGIVVMERYYISYKVKTVLVERGVVPGLDVKKVTLETNDSTRGKYKLLTDNEIQQTIFDGNGNAILVNWEINNSTIFSCIPDLFTTPEGQVHRQSEMLIQFADGTKVPGVNLGIGWFKDNAKSESSVWVFGDKEAKIANEVSLYMDKCSQ